MSFSRGSSVSWAVEVAATSRSLRRVEYMVSLASLCHVYQLCHVSRVPLCIRWLACAWLYGHGMVPAPTGQRRWAQELYILDTDSASIIRPQSRSCAVSSPHCADHVTLTWEWGWGWKGNWRTAVDNLYDTFICLIDGIKDVIFCQLQALHNMEGCYNGTFQKLHEAQTLCSIWYFLRSNIYCIAIMQKTWF